MSSIKTELNKLAKKVGAPVNGKNISEQIASINVHLEGTSHGANISERINEFGDVYGNEPEPPHDGKTRLYCNFEDLCLSPVIGFALDGECVVDWGDSTTLTHMTGTSLTAVKTATHTYSKPGKYVITISPSEESEIGLGGTNYGSMLITPGGVKTPLGQGYRNSLYKLVIGNRVNLDISSSIRNSYSLVHVEISDDVNNISDATFFGCMSLVGIAIPESVSTIGSHALANLYGITFIKFVSKEPPILSSSKAFDALPTDCIIYVPSGSRDTYINATNYPASNSYSYVEY